MTEKYPPELDQEAEAHAFNNAPSKCPVDAYHAIHDAYLAGALKERARKDEAVREERAKVFEWMALQFERAANIAEDEQDERRLVQK